MADADGKDRDVWVDRSPASELDHPHPNRRRVAVLREKPGSLKEYNEYAELKENGKVSYRAFDDSAADAALTIAANAESRIANISGQRIQLTAFNIAISGGLLAYYFGSPPKEDLAQTAAITVSLVLAALTFCFIQLILSKAELFFFHLASRSNYIARKHYRLSDPTWVADAFYQAKLNRWFDRHTFWPMAITNFAIPALSAIALWALK